MVLQWLLWNTAVLIAAKFLVTVRYNRRNKTPTFIIFKRCLRKERRGEFEKISQSP